MVRTTSTDLSRYTQYQWTGEIEQLVIEDFMCSDTNTRISVPEPVTREFDLRGKLNQISIMTYLQGSNIKISYGGGRVNWHEENIRDEIYIPIDKRISFLHDFTFASIREDTDIDLNNFWGLSDLNLEKTTPDWVFSPSASVNTTFIVEFTTVKQGDFLEATKSAFLKKKDKYLPIIKRRLDIMEERHKPMNVVFLIIVVHKDGILSNVSFGKKSHEIFRNLYIRFQIALNTVSSVERDFSIDLCANEDDKTAKDSVKRYLSQIDYDPDCVETYGLMKKEDLQLWTRRIPDKEKVNSYLLDSIKKAKEQIKEEGVMLGYENESHSVAMQLKRRKQETDKIIQKIIQTSCDIPEDRKKKDMDKSICSLPFMVLEKDRYPNNGLAGTPFLSGHGSELNRIWSNARVKALSIEPDLDMEEMIAIVDELDEVPLKDAKHERAVRELKRAKKKSNYHKVKLKIDHEMEIHLARLGVSKGKKHSEVFKTPEVIEKRLEQSRLFSHECNTDDIDMLLENSRDLFVRGVNFKPHELNDILEKARSYHENTEAASLVKDDTQAIEETRIYQHAEMIADLGTELAASFRQNCGSDEFRIKKLQYWPLYVLMRPVKDQIFYSLAWYKKDMIYHKQKPFKRIEEDDDVCMVDFVSVEARKVDNMIKLPLLLKAAMLQDLERFSSKIIPTLENLWFTKSVLLSYLVALNNKPAVEEEMDIVRWVMGEGFVSLPLLPHPAKILEEKLSTGVHDRFVIWIQRKLFTAARRILHTGGFRSKVSENHIEFSNVFHPYTGEEMENPSDFINKYYNGYFVDKRQPVRSNQYGPYYEKILVKEESLREANPEHLGSKDPDSIDDLKEHEFSPSILISAIDDFMQIENDRSSNTFRTELESKILSELSRIPIDDLATLKASTIVDLNKMKKGPNESIHRSKLLEGILKMIPIGEKNKYHDPRHTKQLFIYYLEECIKKSEEDGGLLVSFFRKEQHGGKREIFVTTPHGRVCQFFVETVAKSILSYLKCDALVHPKIKTKRFAEHYKSSERGSEQNKKFFVGASCDASKWSQCNYVSKYMIMFNRLLPPYLAKPITRILSLWGNKLMIIDNDTKNLALKLNSQPERISKVNSNPLYMKLVNGLHTKEVPFWLDKSLGCLKLKSGMLQGILHFTSSLHHSLHAMYFTRLWMKFTNNMDRYLPKEQKIKISINVSISSDDSAYSLSGNDVPAGRNMACVIQLALQHLMKTAGIKPSRPKTLINCNRYLEFNSTYCTGTYTNAASWKQLIATSVLTVHNKIEQRWQQFKSSLGAAIRDGASTYSVAMLQVEQLYLSMRMMGFGKHVLFPIYSDRLLQVPDVRLGFPLLDQPDCCGMLPLDFYEWKLFKADQSYQNRLCSIVDNAASSSDAWSTVDLMNRPDIRPEDCLSMKDWGTLTIDFRNREKAQKLVFNLVDQDVMEQLNELPEVVFDAARSRHEARLKIMSKLLSTSVVESLANDKYSMAKMMASSNYLIHEPIFFYRGRHTGGTLCKAALLNVMRNEMNSVYEKQYSTEEIDKAEGILFTDSRYYAEIDYKLMSNLKHESISHNVKKAGRRQVRIPIFEELESVTSLLNIARWKWFDIRPSNVSREMLAIYWSEAKEKFSFLRDTFQETIDDSKFKSALDLKSWLASLSAKQRYLLISSADFKASTLMGAIKGNFHPSMTLSFSRSEEEREKEYLEKGEGYVTKDLEISKLKHAINSICNSPFKDDVKLNNIRLLLDSSQDIPLNNTIRSKSNDLHMLQWICKNGNFEAGEESACITLPPAVGVKFTKKLWESKQGIILTNVYAYNRQGNRRRGEQRWKGIYMGSPFEVIEHMVDDESVIKDIILSKRFKIDELAAVMNHILEETGAHIPKATLIKKDRIVKRNREFGYEKSMEGAPYQISDVLMKEYRTLDFKNVRVVYDGRIKIIADHTKILYIKRRGKTTKEEKVRSSTLLKYSPTYQDIIESMDMVANDQMRTVPLLKEIITGDPIPLDLAMGMITWLSGTVNSNSFQMGVKGKMAKYVIESEAKQWVAKLWRESLSSRGAGPRIKEMEVVRTVEEFVPHEFEVEEGIGQRMMDELAEFLEQNKEQLVIEREIPDDDESELSYDEYDDIYGDIIRGDVPSPEHEFTGCDFKKIAMEMTKEDYMSGVVAFGTEDDARLYGRRIVLSALTGSRLFDKVANFYIQRMGTAKLSEMFNANVPVPASQEEHLGNLRILYMQEEKPLEDEGPQTDMDMYLFNNM